MQNDAISRKALIDVLNKFRLSDDCMAHEWAIQAADDVAKYTLKAIKNAPALDVAPVVHARWDKVEREAFWIGDQDEWMQTGKPTKRVMPVCSNCKTELGTGAFEYKYCHNCGARMDGEAQ